MLSYPRGRYPLFSVWDPVFQYSDFMIFYFYFKYLIVLQINLIKQFKMLQINSNTMFQF